MVSGSSAAGAMSWHIGVTPKKGNLMKTEKPSTHTPARKLRLGDLQVQSFVTALDEHEASQIASGRWVWTRVSACIEASVEICYAQSQDTFCYKCSVYAS
jgi:hypothetical protein